MHKAIFKFLVPGWIVCKPYTTLQLFDCEISLIHLVMLQQTRFTADLKISLDCNKRSGPATHLFDILNTFYSKRSSYSALDTPGFRLFKLFMTMGLFFFHNQFRELSSRNYPLQNLQEVELMGTTEWRQPTDSYNTVIVSWRNLLKQHGRGSVRT